MLVRKESSIFLENKKNDQRVEELRLSKDTNSEKSDIEMFISMSHIKKYLPKSTVVFSGDKSDSIFYIVKGSVSVVMEDDTGREIIISYLNAGDFFGEVPLFLDEQPESRTAWIRTKSHSSIAEMSHIRCNELLKMRPSLYKKIGAQMARRLMDTTQKVSDLVFLDVTGRVARTLVALTKQPDAITHPDGMQIKITRQEIGRIVGCSREMVGRVLKDLVEDGVISVHGKTMVIYGTR